MKLPLGSKLIQIRSKRTDLSLIQPWGGGGNELHDHSTRCNIRIIILHSYFWLKLNRVTLFENCQINQQTTAIYIVVQLPLLSYLSLLFPFLLK
jgi:hypothetical protein